MSQVEAIEAAIEGLPAEESRRIAEWFRLREQTLRDEQKDADSATGQLREWPSSK
jgi:hypothetical protein